MTLPSDRTPIVAKRVRATNRQSFAFIPHRFVREGFFAALTPDEQRLYFFLVLAADKHGMSFYHYDSICSHLHTHLDVYLRARDGLIDKDLIAFDGSRFQVLSLPDQAPATPSQSNRDQRDNSYDDPLDEERQLAARRAVIRRDLEMLTARP